MSDPRALPAGPLVRHLSAMHDIVVRLGQWSPLDANNFLLAHWHHVQTVAAATAEDPLLGITTRPPGTPDQDVHRAVAWALYRRERGVSDEPAARDREYEAFKAGFNLAYERSTP